MKRLMTSLLTTLAIIYLAPLAAGAITEYRLPPLLSSAK